MMSLTPRVAQLGEHLQPEFGPLCLTHPQTEQLLLAAQADAQRQVDGLVPDRPLVLHLHLQGIQVENRVDAAQWAALPRGDLLEDGVGDTSTP